MTVLPLPARPGKLAWWVPEPDGTAHLAAWRPTSEPGRWQWLLLCPHAKAGYWYEARREHRCPDCLRLIAKAGRAA